MLLTRNIIGAEIVRQAERFVGLYERVNNAVWDDPTTPGQDARADELVRVMQQAGWQPGLAYCAAFAKAMWLLAYAHLGAQPEALHILGRMLSLHCLTTWANAKAEKRNYQGLRPAPGSIALWQHEQTTNGHAGLATAMGGIAASYAFSTIEGNTMPGVVDLSVDREGRGHGDGVFRKVRVMNYQQETGLHLLGFIEPIECEGQPLAIRPDKTEGLS